MGAWVGVVKKCGARTAATRVSVSGNLGDLFDIVSHVCTVCGRMSLPLVCLCVWSSFPEHMAAFCTNVIYDLCVQTCNERTAMEFNLVTA